MGGEHWPVDEEKHRKKISIVSKEGLSPVKDAADNASRCCAGNFWNSDSKTMTRFLEQVGEQRTKQLRRPKREGEPALSPATSLW